MFRAWFQVLNHFQTAILVSTIGATAVRATVVLSLQVAPVAGGEPHHQGGMPHQGGTCSQNCCFNPFQAGWAGQCDTSLHHQKKSSKHTCTKNTEGAWEQAHPLPHPALPRPLHTQGVLPSAGGGKGCLNQTLALVASATCMMILRAQTHFEFLFGVNVVASARVSAGQGNIIPPRICTAHAASFLILTNFALWCFLVSLGVTPTTMKCHWGHCKMSDLAGLHIQ